MAVNFTVDDSANKVFGPGDLEWKGSLRIEAVTRIITWDATWAGPYPKLYDDGPWTSGGHEPRGNSAGDSKWGVTVFAFPPASGEVTYEYGLHDSSQSSGWIWRGQNGSFKLDAGSRDEVTAAGQVMLPFGTTDLMLLLDRNRLAPPDGGAWDTALVSVKGSGWSWNTVQLRDDGTMGDGTAGDGIHTFLLSEYVGPGKLVPHMGLPRAGDTIQFVYLFGDAGVEYRDRTGTSEQAGVSALTKAPAGSFASVPIVIDVTKTTSVVIP